MTARHGGRARCRARRARRRMGKRQHSLHNARPRTGARAFPSYGLPAPGQAAADPGKRRHKLLRAPAHTPAHMHTNSRTRVPKLAAITTIHDETNTCEEPWSRPAARTARARPPPAQQQGRRHGPARAAAGLGSAHLSRHRRSAAAPAAPADPGSPLLPPAGVQHPADPAAAVRTQLRGDHFLGIAKGRFTELCLALSRSFVDDGILERQWTDTVGEGGGRLRRAAARQGHTWRRAGVC